MTTTTTTETPALTPRKIDRLGWIREKFDIRDKPFALIAPAVFAVLPPLVDLRAGMPPVYDQGQIGSCTANAICAACEYAWKKHGQTDFPPSRRFVYYKEREEEGTIRTDSGAMLRDGMDVLHKAGVPHEQYCPYVEADFARKPSAAAVADAAKHKATGYYAVEQTLTGIKSALVQGFPVVIGFEVYAPFESAEVAKSGIVPMPQPGDAYLGGHAVVLCGYNDATQRFLCRNSWGPDWGQGGYFEIPYAYLTDSKLASDLWTLQVIA